MALPNINNGDPLYHNDDFCRHTIVISLEVVNDAAPWSKNGRSYFMKFAITHTQLTLVMLENIDIHQKLY